MGEGTKKYNIKSLDEECCEAELFCLEPVPNLFVGFGFFFVKKDILLLILSHFNESFEANESNIRTSLKINLNRSQRMLLVFVETRRSRFFLFAKKDFNYFALGPRPHPATSVILTIQAGLRRLSDKYLSLGHDLYRFEEPVSDLAALQSIRNTPEYERKSAVPVKAAPKDASCSRFQVTGPSGCRLPRLCLNFVCVKLCAVC